MCCFNHIENKCLNHRSIGKLLQPLDSFWTSLQPSAIGQKYTSLYIVMRRLLLLNREHIDVSQPGQVCPCLSKTCSCACRSLGKNRINKAYCSESGCLTTAPFSEFKKSAERSETRQLRGWTCTAAADRTYCLQPRFIPAGIISVPHTAVGTHKDEMRLWNNMHWMFSCCRRRRGSPNLFTCRYFLTVCSLRTRL